MTTETDTRITIIIPEAHIDKFSAATVLGTPQACWNDTKGNRFAAISFLAPGDFVLPDTLSADVMEYGEGTHPELANRSILLFRNCDGATKIQQLGLLPLLPAC